MIEGTGAAAAEDGELVAGFVHGAVAVNALGDGEGWTFGASGRNEFRRRARAEAGEVGGVVEGRDNLQDAETIFAVGDEGEGASGDHADFYVVDIVELAIRGEELIELWRGGMFHVDNRQTLLACGNVSVGARDIDVAGVFRGHECVRLGLGLREIGDVENFHSVAIDDEGITELNSDGAGIVQERRAEGGSDFRRERIIEIDHDKSFVCEDVGKRAGDGDATRAGKCAVGVEGRELRLRKLLVGSPSSSVPTPGLFDFEIRIADDHQAFFFIRDI